MQWRRKIERENKTDIQECTYLRNDINAASNCIHGKKN